MKMNDAGASVLVVGGAGYIGGIVVDLLQQAGYGLTVFDSLVYEPRYLKPVPFVWGDIRDTNSLLAEASKHDIIVLLAGLVGDPACQVNVQATEEINFLAVRDFVRRLSPSKKLIFISTCSVYGAQDDTLDETSPTNPLSAYASTKLAAEEYVTDFGGTIFRLGTVYGPGDTYSRLRLDLVVNILTAHAIRKKSISIFGGEQWRPIIAATDVAEYIVEACDRDRPGIYVLSRENVLLRDLGQRVADCIEGTKLTLNSIPFQDFRNYKVDNAKSLRDFSYRPRHSVEDEVFRLERIINSRRIKNLEDPVFSNGAFLKVHPEALEFKAPALV